MSRKGAKVMYICTIFSTIDYLIVGPPFTTFWLRNAYLYDLNALAARMLLGPGINAARESAN